MHIALTGASGFIGSVTARKAHEAGHTITALVRPTSRRDHIEPYVTRFVTGTHDDQSAWPALLDGAEAIVHNSVDWTPLRSDDHATHFRSNLLASLELLKASAPRQFVFISTVAVHHDIRPRWNGTIDEDHPLRPAHLYGAYKAAVEAHLWSEHFGSARHTSALRPCAVYGIDPALERSHGYDLILKLKRGEPITKPGGGKFVHVDDVAHAIVATLGNPSAAGRPFNLVDCYARWADWALMARDMLGLDNPVDTSSPAKPENEFTRDAAQSLGVDLNRGHEGIRKHLKQLIAHIQAIAA
jgi:nucleoside-diphosphate-sugar epimerase